MKLAPIVLFVYNRPFHTQQTVEALRNNDFAGESNLFVFSDAPKDETAKDKVGNVRDYIKNLDGFKSVTVVERDKNFGLAKSIIAGVTDVVNQYGKIIVLEDDIVTSPFFLRYMNDGLNFYKDNKEIFTISGYNHPPTLMKFPKRYKEDVYFNYRNFSWGWATWADRWEKADWEVKDFNSFLKDKKAQKRFNRGGDDLTPMLIAQMKGEIDSWAIRWSYAHFKNNVLSVCPVYSYVNNIGHDGTGTHCGTSSVYKNDLSKSKRQCSFIKSIKVNKKVMDAFRKVYQTGSKFSLRKVIKILIMYDLWKK